MKFVIVTGMSGAGKTAAVDKLEDMGYFCVDNVPPSMMGKFAELHQNSTGYAENIAIVVDTRSKESFSQFDEELTKLKNDGFDYKLLFIDANDDVIFNRYKEKRRKHPLVKNSENLDLEEIIAKEREILSKIKLRADFVIDASYTKEAQLKKQIADLFSLESENGLILQVMSFGFKYGIPMDADTVYDVRCLPNPYYIPELKFQTGLDSAVSEYVMQFDESKKMLEKIIDLLDYSYPLYEREGRTRLVIAIGCTGGMHRSVTFAEEIAKYFGHQNVSVVVNHRDKDKVKKML